MNIQSQIIAESLDNYKKGRAVTAREVSQISAFWQDPESTELKDSMESMTRILSVYEKFITDYYFNIDVENTAGMCARATAITSILSKLAMPIQDTFASYQDKYGQYLATLKYGYARWIAENEALYAITDLVDLQFSKAKEMPDNAAEILGITNCEDLDLLEHHTNMSMDILTDVLTARQVVLRQNGLAYTVEEIQEFDSMPLPPELAQIRAAANIDIDNANLSRILFL